VNLLQIVFSQTCFVKKSSSIKLSEKNYLNRFFYFFCGELLPNKFYKIYSENSEGVGAECQAGVDPIFGQHKQMVRMSSVPRRKVQKEKRKEGRKKKERKIDGGRGGVFSSYMYQ
jgi:hypothetical protein